MHVVSKTFEEIGPNNDCFVTVNIQFTPHEGEKRTWDYPGSAPFGEVLDVQIVEYGDENTVDTQPPFAERRYWERKASELVEENWDEIWNDWAESQE